MLLQYYGITEANFYTVLFGVSRSIGILAQVRTITSPLQDQMVSISTQVCYYLLACHLSMLEDGSLLRFVFLSLKSAGRLVKSSWSANREAKIDDYGCFGAEIWKVVHSHTCCSLPERQCRLAFTVVFRQGINNRLVPVMRQNDMQRSITEL